MHKTKFWSLLLGTLFVQAFVVFTLRDFFVPLSAQARHALELLLPGFIWSRPWTYALGLLGSFLWGAYVALLVVPMLSVFSLKHHHWQVHSTRR